MYPVGQPTCVRLGHVPEDVHTPFTQFWFAPQQSVSLPQHFVVSQHRPPHTRWPEGQTAVQTPLRHFWLVGHCESAVHRPQAPFMHTWPVGHGTVAEHARQVPFPVSEPTQTWPLGQGIVVEQREHTPLTQTKPPGQGTVAEHGLHTPFTQSCPPGQGTVSEHAVHLPFEHT
jgi:hypothetical protein